MFAIWHNHYLLLPASLTAASSAGFAQAPVEQKEQATFLSKSIEMLKSSGVATLSLGPVWENTGNTQTFYLAPNIEKAYAANAVVMPDFASNTTTAFTYTVGAGIQRLLNQHWQAGIGYEFADWGRSQLNRASGQTLNNGLSLSHVYTNGFLFNLTYSA